MTQIVGNFVDSGGVAINGELVITLDAPLVDISTTPEKIYTSSPHTFAIANGLISGVDVVQSATSNVTYHFQVNRYDQSYSYYLADGTEYTGPGIVNNDNYYTGTYYDAATSQRLGQVITIVPNTILDFHSIVPNVASVEFATLIPTRISTDSLPRTIRQIAELLTSDLDFVETLRGGPRFKGNYISTTYYQRDDSVNYGGSSWVYINTDPTAGQTPSTINTSYWQILAQKGDAGGTGGNNTVYNATGWAGATDAPSRNAMRDIIETLARTSQLANYALLASPIFTGTPLAPTQAAGNSSTRIATTEFVGNAISFVGTMPIGGMIEWTTGSAPNKWILCDGRAISRTTYAALYAVIGTTYGTGDGSTTFNIPDSRGRVTVGLDNMGTAQGAAGRILSAWASILGGNGGQETRSLTSTESGSQISSNEIAGYGLTSTSPSFTNRVMVSLTKTAFGLLQPGLAVNKIIYAGI